MVIDWVSDLWKPFLIKWTRFISIFHDLRCFLRNGVNFAPSFQVGDIFAEDTFARRGVSEPVLHPWFSNLWNKDLTVILNNWLIIYHLKYSITKVYFFTSSPTPKFFQLSFLCNRSQIVLFFLIFKLLIRPLFRILVLFFIGVK